MELSWVVLIPPALVLLAAFTTKNILKSLSLGIISAAIIATQKTISFEPVQLIGAKFYDQLTDIDTIYLFSFLFIVGIIVTVIDITGGAAAFSQALYTRVSHKKQVEGVALTLPFLLFIDDYLNCLTMGYIMRPLTDKFTIPRAKLAFFIDSMTAPLAILAPISSWAGTIISQMELAGISSDLAENPLIHTDAFWVYLIALPFVFYSYMIMANAWFIVKKNISFGSMHTHEQIANETGNVFGGKEPITFETNKITNPSLYSLTLPIAVLTGAVLVQILWAGDAALFGGNNSLIVAFQQKYNIFKILFIAGCVALAASLLFSFVTRRLSWKDVPQAVRQGIAIMLLAVLTVLLAWVFSSLLRDNLHTGQYLASVLLDKLNPLFLPVMIYTTTFIVGVLTGSSWGAVAIIFPIAIPMIATMLQLTEPTAASAVATTLLPSIGAILSGAAAGDHISPISDTTIMSSTSSGSYHIDHVHTQLEYCWPALIATGGAFLLNSILLNYLPLYASGLIALFCSMLVCFAVLSFLQQDQTK